MSGRPRERRGFTLVEIVISMVIIGVMLVSVLGTVGTSQAIQFKGAQQSEGLLLAEDLMAEILRMPYEDPDQTPVNGLETGEDTGDRSQFDDVDDYDDWAEEPPQDKSGTDIDWAAGYKRKVVVKWLDPDDLKQFPGSESGAKRINVKIKYAGEPVVELRAVRTSSVADPADATRMLDAEHKRYRK